MKAPKIRNRDAALIPIRITCDQPVHVEIWDGISHLVVGLQRKPYKLLQATVDGTRSVTRDLVSLEDPLVVRFINATDEGAMVKFMDRFGVVQRSRSIAISELFHLSDKLWALLIRSTAHDDMTDTLERTNDVLADVVLRPVFATSAKGPQFVLQPGSLLDYMAMEIALAHEVGAIAAKCGFCPNVFLKGTLTRRRIDAKYCSDRCRVADMRKRHKKGSKYVDPKTTVDHPEGQHQGGLGRRLRRR